MEILDTATGASVAFNDDMANLITNSLVTFTPVAGHAYFIRISEYFEDTFTGGYTVTVQ